MIVINEADSFYWKMKYKKLKKYHKLVELGLAEETNYQPYEIVQGP